MFQYRGGMQKTYSSKEIMYQQQIFDQNGYLDVDEIYNMGGERNMAKKIIKKVAAKKTPKKSAKKSK